MTTLTYYVASQCVCKNQTVPPYFSIFGQGEKPTFAVKSSMWFHSGWLQPCPLDQGESDGLSNILAYFKTELITTVKSFIIQAPGQSFQPDQSCGLYNNCFTIVICNRDDSSQYYKTTILALTRFVNYDHNLRSKLKRNLRS
jgi:hypothetical protein